MKNSNIQVNLNLPRNLNHFLIESAKNNRRTIVDEVLSRVANSFERELNPKTHERLEGWLRQQHHVDFDDFVMPHNAKEMIEVLLDKYGCTMRVIATRTNIAMSSLYRYLNGDEASQKSFVSIFNFYCECFYRCRNPKLGQK